MFLPYTTATLGVALIATYVVGRKRRDLRSGMILGLAAWSFALVLTALPVLTYHVSYSASADRFIALCIGAATAAYGLVRKRAIVPPPNPPSTHGDAVAATWLAWLGIVGSLLLLAYSATLGNDLSPTRLIQNLSSIRDNSLQLAVVGIHGPLGILGSLLAPAGYLSLILATQVRVNRVLTVVNLSLIVAVALFYYAGRQTIAVALMMVGVAFWIRGARLRIRVRTIAVIGIIMIGGWYMTTTFVVSRQQDNNPRMLLLVASRADYGPWTRDLALSDRTVGDALVQYAYLSAPVPSLMYYLQSDLAPKPLYGAYSFPIPAVFIKKALGKFSTDQWLVARAKVLRPFKDPGYVANAWATMLRDLFADFGRIGSVLVCALVGVLIAWTRNRFEDTGDAFYHALETYISLIFVFGAFQSLLWTDYVSNGLFLALAVVAARRLVGSAGLRGPGPRTRFETRGRRDST